MSNISNTVYPVLKLNYSEKELFEIFTPTQNDLLLASKITKKRQTKLCFLITLKCFQKLGYFVVTTKIPKIIIQHISKVTQLYISNAQIESYSISNTRERHIQEIRRILKVIPYDSNARHLIVESIAKAAKTKEEPSDLINVAIEELIKNYYELPAFSTLKKAAKRIRQSVNVGYYKIIFNSLSQNSIEKFDKLLEIEETSQYTFWNKLKQEPLSPTVYHLKELVKHLSWLKDQPLSAEIIEKIPYIKIKQFALEAKTLDASKLKEIEKFKRYTLISSLIYIQTSNTIDDLAEMFIKRMGNIHKKEEQHLKNIEKITLMLLIV